jgi:hypothetical protein
LFSCPSLSERGEPDQLEGAHMPRTRKLAALVAVLVGGGLLGQPPAWSAPTSGGIVVPFVCGDASVNILLSPGGTGNKSWSVNDARVADGTTYHVKTFTFRMYEGDLTSPPLDAAPVASFFHAYGARVGQGTAVTCQRHSSIVNPRGTFTSFVTVEATVQN